MQGSSGSFFERWCKRWVLDPRIELAAGTPRLRVAQKDNAHIHLGKEVRSSDATLIEENAAEIYDVDLKKRVKIAAVDVWEMKFYRSGGAIDEAQLDDWVTMKRKDTEFVVNAVDGKKYQIRSLNYVFEDSASAQANARVGDKANLWYVNDAGTLTLMR